MFLQVAKVLWPTPQHFETFQKETGWEERAKEGHFDTGEKHVVRLLNIAAFKEQWDHFAKLQEQSKVTKADRVHIRKAATLIGATKEVRKKREAQAAAKMQRQMQGDESSRTCRDRGQHAARPLHLPTHFYGAIEAGQIFQTYPTICHFSNQRLVPPSTNLA